MNGADRIAAERRRQVEQENWTAEHDDGHSSAELAWAAVCYAAPGRVYVERRTMPDAVVFVDPWPFPAESDASGRGYYDWDKRKREANYVRDMPSDGPERIHFLVKAGALIAAEIDRLQHAEERP